MAVSYKRLWKLLIDKDLKKKYLMENAGISSATMRRLNHNDNVSTESLAKICRALDCRIEDIVELIAEE